MNNQTRAADGRTCLLSIATTNRRHRDGTDSVPGLLEVGVGAGMGIAGGRLSWRRCAVVGSSTAWRGRAAPAKGTSGRSTTGPRRAVLGSEGPLLPSPLHQPQRASRHAMTRPRTLVEKIWDDHVVARTRAHRRSSRSTSISSTRSPRPRRSPGSAPAASRSATRSGPSRRRTTRRRPIRAACRWPTRWPRRRSTSSTRNCAEFGIPLHGLGIAEPGHRPRHRPAARADPAGDDDRLRRLAHGDPRRVRGARVRDRDERGRDGPRDPDPAPARPEDLRGPGRRPARSRRRRPRTSSSRSSPGSASAAAPATCSSTPATPSAR